MTPAAARKDLEQHRAIVRHRLGLTPAVESSGPGDDADEAAARGDRTLLFATKEQLTATLREIDEALDRIAAGTWGVCLACGEAIPAARLKVNAAASRCVPCETIREQQQASVDRPTLRARIADEEPERTDC